MWLYFILLICSISVPLILSFDKNLKFYKQWKYIFPAIIIVAFFYIVCDIYLTKIGIWGFNSRYHINKLIFKLPIEEWLFFIFIPYASIFLHESFILYFPKIKLNNKLTKILTSILILFLLIVIIKNYDKIYTTYIFSFLIIGLILAFLDKTETLNKFYITYLIILIPFFIVNSILTGSFIEQEVVWYNNSENLGIRIATIPIEDFGYGFSLILFNLLIFNKLKSKNSFNHAK